MSSIAAFINARVSSKELSLRDFIEQYHADFEQTLDISFMDYFLELSKRENEGQFIVHHEKLVEYGIATLSSGSTDVPKRLKALGMTMDEDYQVRRTAEQSETSRGVKHKNTYFLTPEAFKLCLMRARKTSSQEIDVSKYAKYYLFLEKVVGYYMECQQLRASKYTQKHKNLKTTQDLLLEKLDKIIDQNDETNGKLNETNGKLNETNGKLDQANADLKDAKKDRTKILGKFDTVVDMLKQKSMVSTMNPANPKLHHNFVVMGYEFSDPEKGKGRKLALIAGQEAHVRKSMREKFNDTAHTWTVQVGMHYNANPIDLRNNIAVRAKAYVAEFITQKNDEFARDAAAENERIREEILEFNRTRAKETPKRVFSKEKIRAKKIARSDIPITWNKMSAAIFENEFIDYDDLLELIRLTNTETQSSPYASDEETPAE